MGHNFIVSQLFVKPRVPTMDRTGQTVIVTGANIGLGLEAARHFVRLNAKRVILAVRSLDKGEAAKKDIEQSTGKKGVVEVWAIDLADYSSVQAFAKRANTELPRLDVLVENAGIAGYTYRRAEDNEAMLTTNVISTFLMALLMLPLLRKTADEHNVQPRLVIVSSEVHAFTKLPEHEAPNMYDLLNDEKKANMKDRYPVSKLLEILYVQELVKHLSDSKVIINTVNPGMCHSSLSRDINQLSFKIAKALLARDTELGSRTLVLAADAGPEAHGKYMSDGHVEDPAKWVQSDKGKAAQAKTWKETNEKLEKIQPGVTQLIKA